MKPGSANRGDFAESALERVAFTPKGGCPLKPKPGWLVRWANAPTGSIHPQGWVPVETRMDEIIEGIKSIYVAFTPKGGCPLKRLYLTLVQFTVL